MNKPNCCEDCFERATVFQGHASYTHNKCVNAACPCHKCSEEHCVREVGHTGFHWSKEDITPKQTIPREEWKLSLASFVTQKKDEGGFTIQALCEYVETIRTAAYEEGYVEGQKYAFGVDRARVEKEGYEKGVLKAVSLIETAWKLNPDEKFNENAEQVFKNVRLQARLQD